jgi:hypothetical protein
MTNLINIAMEDIKGPPMEVKFYLWGGGWQSCYVSFDARKVPLQIISGTLDQRVAFCGEQFISVYEADQVQQLRLLITYCPSLVYEL